MCGAVMATLDELESPSENSSTSVLSIVNRIRPTVEPLFETELRNDYKKLLASSIHANIACSDQSFDARITNARAFGAKGHA